MCVLYLDVILHVKIQSMICSAYMWPELQVRVDELEQTFRRKACEHVFTPGGPIVAFERRETRQLGGHSGWHQNKGRTKEFVRKSTRECEDKRERVVVRKRRAREV